MEIMLNIEKTVPVFLSWGLLAGPCPDIVHQHPTLKEQDCPADEWQDRKTHLFYSYSEQPMNPQELEVRIQTSYNDIFGFQQLSFLICFDSFWRKESAPLPSSDREINNSKNINAGQK